MPKLGEIRKAKELGLNHYHVYIWAACADCGKERWVGLRHGQPNSMRCPKCSIARNNRSEKARTARSLMRGDKSPRWKGGRYVCHGRNVYARVTLQPDDPLFDMVGKDHSCREHRIVMARHLGRCLEAWEVVHHKNGNGLDNRIENLELMDTITHHHLDSTLKAQLTCLKTQVKSLEAEVAMLKLENQSLKGKYEGISA